MQMMPLGVPKVGYKVPHGRYPEWVDIYQRLNRERIIFLTSEIDDEIANQVIGLLLVSLFFSLVCFSWTYSGLYSVS